MPGLLGASAYSPERYAFSCASAVSGLLKSCRRNPQAVPAENHKVRADHDLPARFRERSFRNSRKMVTGIGQWLIAEVEGGVAEIRKARPNPPVELVEEAREAYKRL